MTRHPLYLIIGIACLALGIYFILSDGTPSLRHVPGITSVNGTKVTVDASKVWNNTSISVKSGQTITIQASGKINLGSPGDGADKWVGPDGWGYKLDLLCNGRPCRYINATDSPGCLVAKIGQNGRTVKVSAYNSFNASDSGTLYLGVDDTISDHKGNLLSESELQSQIYFNNRGSFTAAVEVK